MVGQAELCRVGVLIESFISILALGLEPAEFGGGVVEQAMGLGAGAVDGALDPFAMRVHGFHGIRDEVVSIAEEDDEMGFDFTAAAETPGGSVDFFDEELFVSAYGAEGQEECEVEVGMGAFFAGPDEIAGVEAEDDGVFGRCGFSGFGARAGGRLRVRSVGCGLCG